MAEKLLSLRGEPLVAFGPGRVNILVVPGRTERPDASFVVFEKMFWVRDGIRSFHEREKPDFIALTQSVYVPSVFYLKDAF